jgi:hypothetical protein
MDEFRERAEDISLDGQCRRVTPEEAERISELATKIHELLATAGSSDIALSVIGVVIAGGFPEGTNLDPAFEFIRLVADQANAGQRDLPN